MMAGTLKFYSVKRTAVSIDYKQIDPFGINGPKCILIAAVENFSERHLAHSTPSWAFLCQHLIDTSQKAAFRFVEQGTPLEVSIHDDFQLVSGYLS